MKNKAEKKGLSQNDIKNNEKRRLFIVLKITVYVFAALLIVFLTLWGINKIMKGKIIPTRIVDESINFSSVNYDEDIFLDPIYVAKERNIGYYEFSTGELIGAAYDGDNAWHGIAPAELYSRVSDEAKFFRDYFICVIRGDYANYPGFFSENFFKYYSVPKRFTMQKIYDISVNLYNREAVEYNDGTAVIARYIVSYKIMNNNGTFRGDVESNSVKPLYIKLIKYNGEIQIEAISSIKQVKSEDT